MYNSIDKYNDLDQRKVTRSELLELIKLAQEENQTFIVQKISDLLRENPDDKCFIITLKNKIPTYQIEDGLLGALEETSQEFQNEELNAPEKRFESKAKQNCRRLVPQEGVKINGQLKKGYKYLKGGKVVKVTKEKNEKPTEKQAVTKAKTPKIATKKTIEKAVEPKTQTTNKSVKKIDKPQNEKVYTPRSFTIGRKNTFNEIEELWNAL